MLLKMYGSVMSAIINDDYEAALILLKYANDNSSKYMIEVLNSTFESKKRELSKEQIEFIYKMMRKGSYDANDYLMYLFMSAYKANEQHLSKAQVEFINSIIESGCFDVDAHIIFEGFPNRGIYTKDVTHTLLSFALHFGLIDTCNHLLNAGADINAYKGCVLMDAAEAGDIVNIRFALDNGARVDVPDLWRLQDAMDSKLNYDEIRFLLECGLKLEKNRLFSTAVSRNKLEVVKLMVELGVNPEKTGAGLYTAIEMGDYDLVKYLLDYGLKIRGGATSMGNHLACAIRKMDPKIVELLVEYGADPSGKIDEGGNYVNYAMSCQPNNEGEAEQKDLILKFLLTGAPIEYVVKTESEKLADLLYKYGNNKLNWSPLNMALEFGKYEDALFLLDHNADFREINAVAPLDRIFIEPTKIWMDKTYFQNTNHNGTKPLPNYRTTPIPSRDHEAVRKLLFEMTRKGVFDFSKGRTCRSINGILEQILFNKWHDIFEEAVKRVSSNIDWEKLYVYCIRQNDEQAIRILGINSRHVNVNQLLVLAIKNDSVHFAKYFIISGANVHYKDEATKKSLLQIAKKKEIIEILLAKGAKI